MSGNDLVIIISSAIVFAMFLAAALFITRDPEKRYSIKH